MELLIVEWNPPEDRRRVIDAFVRKRRRKTKRDQSELI
jgi:hypothetical protein